jgi:hypothetical protein
MLDKIEKLKKLKELLDKGLIDKTELDALKSKVLSSGSNSKKPETKSDEPTKSNRVEVFPPMVSDPKISEAPKVIPVKSNDITLDQVKEVGLGPSKIKEEKVIKIAINKELECQKIKDNKYSVGQIKKFINDDSLSKEDLFNQASMQEAHYQRIKNYNKRPTEFHEWEDIPNIQKNRTDIYFLGQPGSGKSCILASLFHHANEDGLIVENQINPVGNKYRLQLADEIQFGVLPDSTIADAKRGVNYIPIDLAEDIDDNGIAKNVHPLNFVEMSGEFFNDTLDPKKGLSSMNARGFLENNNKKLIFFVLDYQQHMERKQGSSGSASQGSKFQNSLALLDQFGTLAKTDGIYILISKSDLFPKGVDKNEYAKDFIKNNYKGFYNNCKMLTNKYNNNFDLTFFPYSLGEVVYKNLLTRFDHQPPNDLLKFICNSSFVKSKSSSWS